MPHLVIKNVKKDEFTTQVKDLSKKLTEIIGCPEDWITISYAGETLTYIAGEDMTDENVFVEVKWFDRPQEMKIVVQKIINDAFAKEGRDIMIIFETLTKENYFENGEITQ